MTHQEHTYLQALEHVLVLIKRAEYSGIIISSEEVEDIIIQLSKPENRPPIYVLP